jgi:hypothetical protein
MERKFGVLDRRSTARPGLGLDIIHFNLEDFLVEANIITQKEDHFDRRVREIFHKVNEKMGYEEFRLISLIFGYFRLFSKSVYQVKKISQFRLLIVLSLFWKDSFLETIYSVISSHHPIRKFWILC